MKTNIRTILAALAAFTIIATIAHAAPGSLDTTFGTGGKVTTAIGSDDDRARGVAVQPDGKIVVAGSTLVSGTYRVALARYNTNGTPDTTLDADGKVTTPIGDNGHGYSVAVQPDGKIVVAGEVLRLGTYDFALLRYNADGSLDTSFDGDGLVGTPVGTGSDRGNSVALQTDGKILVAGYAYNASFGDYDFALLRYNANGSLDTTFASGGKATADFGDTDDQAYSLAVQADGKVVVAGEVDFGSITRFALARFNAAGVLDTAFGTGGKVNTAIGSTSDTGYGVAIQTDGRIVVAGASNNGADYDFALARYNANGSLDTTFNATGKVGVDFGGSDFALCLAVQADGKIVAAGRSDTGPTEFALARFNKDGSLDTSFNGTGKVVTDAGDAGAGDSIDAVAIQADGKIVGVGTSNNGTDDDFALVRFSVALPDTRLGATAVAPVGNNRYNLTGAGQTLNTAIRHGGAVRTDFVRIQNDGPVAESFKVRGTPGNAKFAVKYLNGAADVTRRVVAGTFSTGPLNPGASKLLKAVITAKTPLPAQKRTLSILATSASDPAGKDKALIKARSQ